MPSRSPPVRRPTGCLLRNWGSRSPKWTIRDPLPRSRRRAGEVGLSVSAEGRDQAAVVAGTGGQHDVAWLDPLEWDRGDVGSQVADVADRDDHGLSGTRESPTPAARVPHSRRASPTPASPEVHTDAIVRPAVP